MTRLLLLLGLALVFALPGIALTGQGFARVMLQPGETRALTFTLDRAAMAFFDPGKGDWVAENGAFEVRVGASSRDIRLKGPFSLVD